MKFGKREIYSRVHKMPDVRFVDQRLTSFAGSIIFQPLLSKLELKRRLRSCFAHLSEGSIFGRHFLMLLRPTSKTAANPRPGSTSTASSSSARGAGSSTKNP